jgi:serine protease Do
MKTGAKMAWGIVGGGLLGASIILTAQTTSTPSQPGGNKDAPPKAPEINVETRPVTRETRMSTSFSALIKKAAPSVVNIYTSKSSADPEALSLDPFFGGRRRSRSTPEQSLGSGVIISKDGYILTNNHVVEQADEIKVAFDNDRKVFTARLVGADPATDLAVLKIDATDLTAMTMADSEQLQVGDVVLAIGNPFGVGQTVTMGIVSAVSRAFGIVDYEDFIQTDASINPGNSGGALVDAEGRLVGINTAILSRTGGNQGVGFAVPINMARFIMERIIKDGKVVRGYLGVAVQTINPSLAEAFKLPDLNGALVGEITPNSPAAEAGLKPEDVIVEVDGKKIIDSRQLRLLMAQSAPGTKVKLTLLRSGKRQSVTAELDEMPTEREQTLGLQTPPGRSPTTTADPLDGVQVADLDFRVRRQFSISPNVRGALVMDLEERSPAARSGLAPGDVIVEINRQAVRNADEAVQLGRQVKNGKVLLRVWRNGVTRYLVVESDRRPAPAPNRNERRLR